MNFLAHAYLAFGDKDHIVGGLIADAVKGKQMKEYPQGICQGIQLHRLIDSFTDSHPVVVQTANVFKETAGRYSGSFLDVAFDHFLSLDQDNIPSGGWLDFADGCYNAIEARGEILPSKFCSMYLYMKRENWLAHYGELWLIEKSFERLTNRASYLSDDVVVFNDFIDKYDIIKDGFNQFFPELKVYAKSILTEINESNY